jgi:ribosomal protein S18 acetylase RimI-like enzyme
MTDLRYYILLASESGVFKDIELDIMKEALEEWERRADNKSTLVEISLSGRVSGFAYFGPHNGTDYTYELKWVIVGRLSAKQDVGRQLLDRVEEEILRAKPNAVLSVETSSLKEGAIASDFFLQAGFSLIGRIPNFYGKGDDYLMYAKHIHTHEIETDAPVAPSQP